jgi:hypothetical protein
LSYSCRLTLIACAAAVPLILIFCFLLRPHARQTRVSSAQIQLVPSQGKKLKVSAGYGVK